MEVMVAADNKMLRYHGDDLERYILTLMSIVSRGFRGKRNLFWIFNETALLQLANMSVSFVFWNIMKKIIKILAVIKLCNVW